MDKIWRFPSYSLGLLVGLGCGLVDHGGWGAAMGRVGSEVAVEGHPAGNASLGPGAGLLGVQVDAFILQRPPKPLDEDVVDAAAWPSIEMRTPACLKRVVQANDVNCDPWRRLGTRTDGATMLHVHNFRRAEIDVGGPPYRPARRHPRHPRGVRSPSSSDRWRHDGSLH